MGAEDGKETGRPDSEAPRDMPQEKKSTIMVVDDDKTYREMLERLLAYAGYEVLAAPNGLKLLSILKVNHPDVILLDIMMSWIDGYKLCRIIKSTEEFRHIPVIFVSARNTKADIEKGFEAGCADYFVKPFDNERLLKRIRTLIN